MQLATPHFLPDCIGQQLQANVFCQHDADVIFFAKLFFVFER